MTLPPLCEVYVLTHDRPSLLARAVASAVVDARSLPSSATVLVVSSGRRPGNLPAGVLLLHRPHLSGAAAKRRFVLEHSTATWIIFLDDDCEVVPGSLVALYAAVGAAGGGADVGAVYPRLEFDGASTLAFDAASASGLTAGMSWLTGPDERFRWGPSALVLLRRTAALEVGAFDPRTFGIPAGGEDVDMARRLELAGWRRLPCSAATVRHTRSTWNTVAANVARARSYGWAESELLRLHPGDGVNRVPSPWRLLQSIAARCRATPATTPSAQPLARRWAMAGIAALYGLAYRCGRIAHAVQHRSPRGLVRRYDWTRDIGRAA